MNHRWTSLKTLNLSLLPSYHTKLTGANKVLFQLLKIKVTVDHAGHFLLLLFLSHTPQSLLGFSLIFLPNKLLPVLLILISVEALATAVVQHLVSHLTTLLKARVCMRNSNTLTPHTMALKALVQCLNFKLPKYKFQVSSSLLKITISN